MLGIIGAKWFNENDFSGNYSVINAGGNKG